MSVWIRTALLCLTLFCGALRAQAARTDDLSAEDTAVIREMYHLWASTADDIWISAGEIRAPLVYVKERAEYAVGFPVAVRGFTPLPYSADLNLTVQVRPRTFPVHISASFPIEGAVAVVIASPALLNKSPEEWVIVAQHEMFHVFQSARGSQAKIAALEIGSPEQAGSWQLNFPFAYTDEDVMRLIHLQGNSLWLAATGQDRAETLYDVGTAIDAVNVYRRLLDQLNPKSYRYSEFQEWNEGVAKYTEYRFAERATQPNYKPELRFRSLHGFKGYAELWKSTYANVPHLVKNAGRAAQNRDAFYHLGLGKSLALDNVSRDWKKKYFTKDLWLDDLLSESLAGAK